MAKSNDLDIHRTIGDHGVVSLDGVDDLIAREDDARVSDQQQDSELGWRQLDLSLANLDEMARRVAGAKSRA